MYLEKPGNFARLFVGEIPVCLRDLQKTTDAKLANILYIIQ
jgi:hypothetical protein